MLNNERILLTAADQKFFKPLFNLIQSYYRSKNHKSCNFLLYDLGLDETSLKVLDNYIQEKNLPLIIERLNFNSYPLHIRPEAGSYAWKPIIIQKVLNETKANVLWMDSANLIRTELEGIWEEITLKGLYLPLSGTGTIAEWTHPGTFQFFDQFTSYNSRNRCGGLNGFNFNNSSSCHLVNEWVKYAMIKDCILPSGANRSNHRHDQSILSILVTLPEFQQLQLTNDEVNISSKKPIKTIIVRNKIPSWMPVWTLPIGRWYYTIRFYADILINRFIK